MRVRMLVLLAFLAPALGGATFLLPSSAARNRNYASGPTSAVTTRAAHATVFKLAENTSEDIHVGMGALTNIVNCCRALLSTRPPVREVWNWNAGDPGLYPMIYKGEYFPEDRQPDIRYNPGAKPLSWFIKHHPNWIEFTCAAAKVGESQAIKDGDVAYEFGERAYIPLNTVDPSVLGWLETTFYGPAAASGLYQHLDFDNFQTNNGGSWSGMRCGHYDVHGKWVQQYRGSEHDPKYRANKVTFAKDVQAWMHVHYPDVAFAANVSWHKDYLGQETRLLSHVDFWFDEQGFTNGNVGAPWKFLDKVWHEKARAVRNFLSVGDRGWEDVNKEPGGLSQTTRAERQWDIANYLLFKNDHSWLMICPASNCYEQSKPIIYPEYAAAVGVATDNYYLNQGVYRRDFTTGLTFVNPSSKKSFNVRLPAGTYMDLYGHVMGGSVTLGPGSGLVLVKRAAAVATLIP